MNPTVLRAGYKVNVVPQTATAEVDGRFLPGYEEEFFAELDRVLGPGVTREFIHHDIALETTPDGDLYDAMTSALLAEDPGARVIPYCLSAGTDAKSFSRLGMRCFGFTPAAAAARSGLFRNVPRYRRACPGRRPAVRGPGPGRVPRPLLACRTTGADLLASDRHIKIRSGSGRSSRQVTGTVRPRLGFQKKYRAAARAQNVRTGRMIRLRRVAFLLPSALSESLDSSQSPYSAWSVRIRRAASRASRDVPRGRYTTR